MEEKPEPSFESRLGYRFTNRSLLDLALTHASAKDDQHPSNQRLEFLGDAVLGLAVAEFLFRSFPDMDEGALTRVRSGVVSSPALARFGNMLGLEREIHLGKGLRREGLSSAVLANVVEGVIGAVYLDGGLGAACEVIERGLGEVIADELSQPSAPNWKSQLQEHTQEALKVTPSYEVVTEQGPDHRKLFEVAALVGGVERGRGRGSSKKLAEQAAAKEALLRLQEGGELE